MNKQNYVYILASKRNGTLYVGVTSNLEKRIYEHKTKALKGFTDKYEIGHLVWFEKHGTIASAILREKQIKKWNRQWKLRLIENNNSNWEDLSEKLFDWIPAFAGMTGQGRG